MIKMAINRRLNPNFFYFRKKMKTLGGTKLTKKINLEIIFNDQPNITRLPLWIGQKILTRLNQKPRPKEPNHRLRSLKVGKKT